MPPADPDKRYAAIVKSLARKRGVINEIAGATGQKGFGSTGQLKVNNRIFAMLVRGSLVVKLPRARVDELVQTGQGMRFDPRRNGRLMKEWLVVAPTSRADWQLLADEALRFVGA
ncbi:MAG TPA: hypothetical protein VFR68_09830 [Candidatus Dormibacteraeota bacterium]|nr:hypothetical protein [Candidatus Dormibacteraeota bacterium]